MSKRKKPDYSSLTKKELAAVLAAYEDGTYGISHAGTQESGNILAETADRLPVGIFRMTLDGGFVTANNAFLNFSGYTLDELTALKNGWSLFTDGSSLKKEIDRLSCNEAYNALSAYIKKRSGAECRCKMILVKHTVDDGSTVFIDGLAENITEDHVLRQKQIQSEKLQALSSLVSGVAHEINNPLAIITGFTELLRNDESFNREHLDKINKIHDASLRCAKIVKNMLGFARETDVSHHEVALNSLLEEVLSVKNKLFVSDSITVVSKFQDSIPKIRGDVSLLFTVFENVIDNAREALLEVNNNRVITVSTRSNEESVFIEIVDNGPGIPSDVQDRLFDPFFTTKPPGLGTGLGLSLCYGVIEEHGGTIYLDSDVTEGAKFVIILPVDKVYTNGKDLKQIHPAGIQQKKALVVDDEVDIAHLIKEILELNDFEVDIAHNGKEAMRQLQNNVYSFAVIDIRMPGTIDGMNIYSYCRENSRKLSENILFVTGDIMSSEVKSFFEQNPVDYIQKPFKLKDFLNKVEKLIANDR
ncbi:ATP-binding protein [candidate division KSB1 bacterium]